MTDLFKLILDILASRFKARTTPEAEKCGPTATDQRASPADAVISRPVLGGLHQ
jgi:hypothetical protein